MKNHIAGLAILLCPVSAVTADHPRADYGHVHAPMLGAGGLLDPFEHVHFSNLGTPIVHSFGVEPAFTGRDLFLDYRYRTGDGFTEDEIELELEWAFTRRFGVIVEVPYLFEDVDGFASSDGFGDLAIVPRVILLERDRFILTSQIEVVAPTGTDGFGGETALAPGIVTWLDLGGWWTLNSQMAVEHVFDVDEADFLFGFGLVKSFGQVGNRPDSHGHATSAGLCHLHFEVTGSVGLSGEGKGEFGAEGLVGIGYGVSPNMDVRVGYEFPLTSPREFDGGLRAGVVWHF